MSKLLDRPIAHASDLGQTKLIDGTWYTGTATAIKTGPDEYETQVRWYLAKWKDVAKAKRQEQTAALAAMQLSHQTGTMDSRGYGQPLPYSLTDWLNDKRAKEIK